MEKSRIKLHNTLVDILGNRNVYYQPPESIRLQYPCIIYGLKDITSNNADNLKYIKTLHYKITLICNNPDSDYVEKLLDLDYMSFENSFQTQGLYHFVFSKKQNIEKGE